MTEWLRTGAYEMFFMFSRICHIAAYYCYGFGVFCVEGFHLEGVGTAFAWGLGGLYVFSSTLEVLCVAELLGAMTRILELVYSVSLVGTHIGCLAWALVF